MRTNIRQVAALAGVSRTTVSNVLLGKDGRVAPAKREQVLRVVQELGYVPVRPALQNRTGETRVLAIALHDPAETRYEFHSKVYAGICEAALRHDYDVLTVLRADPDWAVNRTAIRLLDRRSDGILFLPSVEDNSVTLRALAEHGIPAVVCYRREVPDGIAWVDPDNQAAIQGMIDLLVTAGHRRIAHLTYFLKNQFDFRDRRRSFIEAIDNARLPLLPGGVVEAEDGVNCAVAERLVATGATAVVCASDGLALRLWDILSSLGVHVPDDMSLTGVDNLPAAEGRGLTTMGFSSSEVGGLAVEALIGLISGKSVSECCREVAPRPYVRDSVCRV